MAVGLLLLELGLRVLLFADGGRLANAGRRLRKPGLYTAGPQTEDYWKLVALLDPEKADRVHPFHDPLLGWRKNAIEAGTYRHVEDERIGERRPVLFYGDSFTECTTGRGSCWEALLERSDLKSELCMLNYGVAGYGVDQIYLLLEASIDVYAARDPIVVVGILIDDDLDRTCLGLRSFPRPRIRLVDERPVSDPVPAESALQYLEREPLHVVSYVARFLVHGSGLFHDVPDRLREKQAFDTPEEVREKSAVNRRLLQEMVATLEARGLDHFFVLFHGQHTTKDPGRRDWREELVRDTLDGLSAPFVSSLDALVADSTATGRPLQDYFLHEGRRIKHYPPATNEVVFRPILAELERIVAGERND